MEAKHKGIVPFALTVDKEGHDYLGQMCGDMAYEVLGDIELLPSPPADALPQADGVGEPHPLPPLRPTERGFRRIVLRLSKGDRGRGGLRT